MSAPEFEFLLQQLAHYFPEQRSPDNDKPDNYSPRAAILASQKTFPGLSDFLQSRHCTLSLFPHLGAETTGKSTIHHPHTKPPVDLATSKMPTAAFGIVIDYLEHLDKSLAVQQLALLRNRYCKHIWLAIDRDCQSWRFQDFISLGFKRLGQFALPCDEGDRVLQSYGYDLALYNRKRDWNNPRFWANPEQWGKRW